MEMKPKEKVQEKCNQILSKTTFHNIEIRDIWAYVTVLRNEMDQLEQQIAKQKQAGVDPVQPIRDIDHQRTELMTKIIRQVCDLIGYLRKEIRAYQEEIRILKQNPSCYLEKNGKRYLTSDAKNKIHEKQRAISDLTFVLDIVRNIDKTRKRGEARLQQDIFAKRSEAMTNDSVIDDGKIEAHPAYEMMEVLLADEEYYPALCNLLKRYKSYVDVYDGNGFRLPVILIYKYFDNLALQFASTKKKPLDYVDPNYYLALYRYLEENQLLHLSKAEQEEINRLVLQGALYYRSRKDTRGKVDKIIADFHELFQEAADSRKEVKMELKEDIFDEYQKDYRFLPTCIFPFSEETIPNYAFSVIPLVEGGFSLYIHVLDLSAFIEKYSPLDQKMRTKMFSGMDLKRALLPEELIRKEIALLEGKLRPALTYHLTFNFAGDCLDFRIEPSQIKVDRVVPFTKLSDPFLLQDEELWPYFSLNRCINRKRYHKNFEFRDTFEDNLLGTTEREMVSFLKHHHYPFIHSHSEKLAQVTYHLLTDTAKSRYALGKEENDRVHEVLQQPLSKNYFSTSRNVKGVTHIHLFDPLFNYLTMSFQRTIKENYLVLRKQNRPFFSLPYEKKEQIWNRLMEVLRSRDEKQFHRLTEEMKEEICLRIAPLVNSLDFSKPWSYEVTREVLYQVRLLLQERSDEVTLLPEHRAQIQEELTTLANEANVTINHGYYKKR